MGPVYADLFALYPVNLALDGETLIIQTAAELGMGDALDSFQGQPHPAYINPQHVHPDIDDTLLHSLLALWKSRPGGQREEQFRRRIFRSLETAYQSLSSPYVNLGSEYDHGLAMSLWVSAFEILAAHGGALGSRMSRS